MFRSLVVAQSQSRPAGTGTLSVAREHGAATQAHDRTERSRRETAPSRRGAWGDHDNRSIPPHGTHPQTGTRDKKHLLDLSLIEEERITIRRGRGGTAVAIRPTRAGHERAKTKPHGTRGGDSIQHEYLVRAIANKITGAKIDVTVGTKAVDILIAYDNHGKLARVIGTTPPEGALIAIEVEVSSPDKTAPHNIECNRAVGISDTITATMAPLRRTPHSALVMDVFDLLEAL